MGARYSEVETNTGVKWQVAQVVRYHAWLRFGMTMAIWCIGFTPSQLECVFAQLCG